MSGTPTEVFPNPPKPADMLILARGLGGAIVGAIIGYLLFRLLGRLSLGAHAIPGAAIGMAAGWAARDKNQLLGILCALASIALVIVAEWQRAPFIKDKSFVFFITHLLDMDRATIKLVLMGLGAACAYWFGQGR